MELIYFRDVEDACDDDCFFHCEESRKKDREILRILKELGVRYRIVHVRCDHSINCSNVSYLDSVDVYYSLLMEVEGLKELRTSLHKHRVAPALGVKKQNLEKLVHGYDEILGFLSRLKVVKSH